MPETFDAYYKWLGISSKDQPPSHYRLLGIDIFEDNPDVITSAADKLMAHIRSFQTGQHSALSQRILNEIATARICLLNAEKKAKYDEKLRGQAALECQPQETGLFDPSQLGIDLTAPKRPPAIKQPRRSDGTKLPWQLPAAMGAGLLASVTIFVYLSMKVPEGERAETQAEAEPQAKSTADGMKPKEANPSKPEPPLREPQPSKVDPKPDPEPPKPGPQSEPKPEPKPEPLADPPEKVAERVKDAFAKAKTTDDFRAVAVDALKLIEQAHTVGKQDVAKTAVTLALSAARKAEDDELAKTATICFLEPGTRTSLTADKSSPDNQELLTANHRKLRLPAPDTAAQEQALKLVREVFKEKSSSATTSEKQKALAQEVLQMAQSTNDDPTGQYVMFKEAGRFAIQAKDTKTAFQVIEEIGARFDVDVLDLKIKAMIVIGKSTMPQQEAKAIVGTLLALMKEAAARGHYDAAKQLGTTLIDAARKSKDSAFIKDTVTRKGTLIMEIMEMQKAQAEVAEAVDALDKNPTDPAANLAAGKHRCFVQGKWNHGISMLALGDDPDLKDLAVKELKGTTDAVEQTNLGDAWWDVGEKKNGLAKKNIQSHAASWYEQALPGLTGLMRNKVEKRLTVTGGSSQDREKVPPLSTTAKTWKIVFRSANPEIWNTAVENSRSEYAIPIAKMPDDMKYVRLQIDKTSPIIIPITKERLGVQSTKGRYGWEGTNRFRWGGCHLGVFDMNSTGRQGSISIACRDTGSANACLGWGFGHRHKLDDGQAYSWAGVEIPKSVMEISVKSVELTSMEQEHLRTPKVTDGDFIMTDFIGSTAGKVYEDLPNPRRLLVGFNITTSMYSGTIPVVRSIQPIYSGLARTTDSRVYGKAEGDIITIEAKRDYAVAGIVGKGGLLVDGFKMIFMRVGRRLLDMRDSYEGDWIGGRGGGEEKKLGGDGTPVIGIYGRSGNDLNSLGLIQGQAAR